jgi:flagellar hook-length control protein FliK
MSGKVSAATSASASANIAGGKSVAATGAAAGAGNAGSDGVAAAPGARSAAGPGSNPGAGAGSDGRFSSAMADAAHAGEQTADAPLSKPNADGAAEHGAPASPAISEASPEVSADVLQLLGTAAAKSNSSAAGASGSAAAGKAGGSKAALKSSADARGSAADTAPAASTEPVMLAMLLAASGMQLTNAGSASNAAAGAADTADDGRQAAIPVTRLAARVIAGLPASDSSVDTATDPVVSAAATAVASPATASVTANATAGAPASSDANSPTPAASVPDATDSATAAASAASVGADASGKSALPAARNAITDTTPAQPSIMTGSSGLPELVRSFAGSATQAAPVEASISVPVANSDWPHAVAAQVHWFVNNDVQSATLRLSPEHLGPVEVRIDVHDSQVNVNFTATHADTRAALEQTVPRLREILSGGGLTLGQTNVQQDPRPGSQSAASAARPAFTTAQAVEPVAVAAPQGLGLVDEYA